MYGKKGYRLHKVSRVASGSVVFRELVSSAQCRMDIAIQVASEDNSVSERQTPIFLVDGVVEVGYDRSICYA